MAFLGYVKFGVRGSAPQVLFFQGKNLHKKSWMDVCVSWWKSCVFWTAGCGWFFSQVLGLLNVSQMVIFWCWSHGTGIERQGMSDVQVIFWAEVIIYLTLSEEEGSSVREAIFWKCRQWPRWHVFMFWWGGFSMQKGWQFFHKVGWCCKTVRGAPSVEINIFPMAEKTKSWKYITFLSETKIVQKPQWLLVWCYCWWEGILHQWIGTLPHYLQGLIHLRWLGMGFLKHQQ